MKRERVILAVAPLVAYLAASLVTWYLWSSPVVTAVHLAVVSFIIGRFAYLCGYPKWFVVIIAILGLVPTVQIIPWAGLLVWGRKRAPQEA